MPLSSRRDSADLNLVKPGDIVWLDAKHLTPTRGTGAHTWPHSAACLFYYDPVARTVPNVIVTGTDFQFACISSIAKNNPLDPTKQVRLDPADPNLALRVRVRSSQRPANPAQEWAFRRRAELAAGTGIGFSHTL